ncbi:MAG: hypothetical protein FWB85_08430 [Chitinispirillia bacterium]|nr:hypothetical protein [Chitinispirillia bacterium]
MKRLTLFLIMLFTATALAQDPVYVMEDFRSELIAVTFEDTGTALTPKSSAATRRNAAYVAGRVILAGGITIHILF